MASTKLQSVVQRQLPEFIREDYPVFTDFLRAYYEYLDTIDDRDILEMRDIDSTVDSFIDYFRGEIGFNVPTFDHIDMRLFLRKSKQAFVAKGTEESYKFLFRILFNKPVEITYPWDSVLKASDGKWQRDTSVFVQFPAVMSVVATDIIPGVTYRIIQLGTTDFTKCGSSNNQLNTTFVATSAGLGTGVVTTDDELQAITAADSFIGNQVTVANQIESRSVKVYVDRITKIRTRVYELSIDKNYYGDILIGDYVHFGNYLIPISPTTVGYKILNSGMNYKVGELIQGSISQGGVNITQTLKVTKIDSMGGIVGLVPVKFGCGYSDDFYLLTTKQNISTKSVVTLKDNTTQAILYSTPETGVDGYVDRGTLVTPDTFVTDYTIAGGGTITVALSGTSVIGVNTKFLSAVKVGYKLTTSTGTVIGTVTAISTDTALTISAAAVAVTASAYNIQTFGVGTITTTTSSATVTGVGTAFNTAFLVGDQIKDSTGATIGTVLSIASATSMTLSANAAIAVTGGSYIILDLYTNPTYAGTILKSFYNTTVNNSVDMENMALIEFNIGGVAKYQGYYISNDGFLNDSIRLQDSEFYQKYSYVVTVDENIEAYRSYVKSFLHSAGMAMFGEYQISNTYDPGVTGQMIMGLGY